MPNTTKTTLSAEFSLKPCDTDNTWETSKHYLKVPFNIEDQNEMLMLLKATEKSSNNTTDEKNNVVGFNKMLQQDGIVSGTICNITNSVVTVEVPGLKSEYNIPLNEFLSVGDTDLTVGNTIEVMYMSKSDQSGFTLSRRMAVLEQHWNWLIETGYSDNPVITAKVVKRARLGFKVDLGYEIDGFLPNSQTNWASADAFFEAFVGQKTLVKLIRFDHVRRNAVVSIRALYETDDLAKKQAELLASLVPGTVCKGVIKNIVSFGIFLSIDGLVDGLLYLKDLSYKRLSHPSEAGYSFGDELEVLILKNEDSRLSFGLKQLTKNPWSNVDTNYPIGTKVKGVVSNIVPYGIFVEVEPGIEGLIHLSEISINTIAKDVYSCGIDKGDVLEASVIYSNEESMKLSLSMLRQVGEAGKAANLEQKFPIGSIFKARVESIISYCAIVELEDDTYAQMHLPNSDIQLDLNINDIIDVLILKIVPVSPDADETSLHKVIVGLQQAIPEPWNSIQERFKVGDKVNVVVSSVTAFGALLYVCKDIVGIIHVSDFTHDPLSKSEEVFKVDDALTLNVYRIDVQNRKIIFVNNTKFENADSSSSTTRALTRQRKNI